MDIKEKMCIRDSSKSMDWQFWKKACADNTLEDDKQVSLPPAKLNRNNKNDEKQYRSVLNLAQKLQEKDV